MGLLRTTKTNNQVGMETDETETVMITVARLRELEAAAAALPVVAAKLAKRTHNDIGKLRAYDAAHPEKAAERRKKYDDAHREEVNAKRREKRRLARLAPGSADAVVQPPGSTDAVVPPPGNLCPE